MNRYQRNLTTIRIVVLILVGLIFLIARFVKAQDPTAADIAKKETVASAFTRGFGYQEYQVRAAAEAMPEDKYGYRPAEGMFKKEKPEFGPAEVRTFAEQVKHVACANFGFAAEMDGGKPPEACDKGGPSPAKTKRELLIYLRDSFKVVDKSMSAMTDKNMFDPIEGPYGGPNTRLGLATTIIWPPPTTTARLRSIFASTELFLLLAVPTHRKFRTPTKTR